VARSLCGGEQCGAARDSGHGETAGGESSSGDMSADTSADAGSDLGDFDGGDFGEV
jgi:hypothetical protein